MAFHQENNFRSASDGNARADAPCRRVVRSRDLPGDHNEDVYRRGAKENAKHSLRCRDGDEAHGTSIADPAYVTADELSLSFLRRRRPAEPSVTLSGSSR